MLSSPSNSISANARRMAALTLSAALLSACASTPPSRTLLNGIQASDLASKSGSVDVNGLRAASDPVCAQFYQNAVEFSKASNTGQPNPFGQILAATGISVLAAVATNGLLGGGNNSIGDIAARQATSQLIFTGGNAAVSGLSTSRGPDRKIISQAKAIGCPVSLG